MTTFTYFAYGSNMLLEHLRKRCKTARFLGIAVAHGYTLVFSKKSKDGSGKATIAKTGDEGTAVYGALFEIDLNERRFLDKAEGGYERDDKFAVTQADNNEKLTATTYVAKPAAIEENLVPYDWYKRLIVAGAWQGKFPASYLGRLTDIGSIPDPCLEREYRKEALATLDKSGCEGCMRTYIKMKIAGEYTVADWITLNANLEPGKNPDNWKLAYKNFFLTRLETRYFEPIRLLIDHCDKDGEGFAIVTLQCSLIEFLASTLAGKNYKHCPTDADRAKLKEHEYYDSNDLFVRFLSSENLLQPALSKTQAGKFYKNVRCALIHEARTKGGWKIHAGDNTDIPIDVKEKIVYRNNLQTAFDEFVKQYGEDLPHCDKLQRAFIIKFDSLCQE